MSGAPITEAVWPRAMSYMTALVDCEDAEREKVLTRFWSLVRKTDDCWAWDGPQRTPGGYGRFHIKGNAVQAHRMSYEISVGPIAPGLVIDHLCRNPNCVRPDHLEAVSQKENTRRGISPAAENAKKTHCPRGHDLSIYGKSLKHTTYRDCRECKRNLQQVRRLKYIADAEARGRVAGLCAAEEQLEEYAQNRFNDMDPRGHGIVMEAKRRVVALLAPATETP